MMRNSLWCLLVASLLLGAAVSPAAQPARSGAQEFLRECETRADAASKAGRMVVQGKDGWLFFAGELRHLASAPFWSEDATAEKGPVAAILDFRKQLDALGIELILLPVPPKAVVYPDKLSDLAPGVAGKPLRTDATLQQFYGTLRKKGVTVLDLTDEFIAARQEDTKLGAMYCRQDSHWSGRSCQATARILAAEIAKRPWYAASRRSQMRAASHTVEIEGELWKQLPEPRPAREKMALRKVSLETGAGPVQPDRSSPIILLGDSHTLVFSAGGDMMATGSGLFDQLALETGIVPDLIGVRGSGATPARINLYRKVSDDPAYLRGKKLIVWCFSAREFTDTSAWRKVPVRKK